MNDNSQNDSNKILESSNGENLGTSSNASQKQIFQASPTGGVVATLLPGQKGFDDLVRVESDRKDGFTQQDNLAQGKDQQFNPIVVKKSSHEIETANLVEEEKEPEAPETVAKYKVGKEKKIKIKKSFLFPTVLSVLLLMVVGSFAYYFYDKEMSKPQDAPVVTENVVLDYWGLWEPGSVLTQVIKDFESLNPGISVRYTKQNVKGYKQRLQEALQSPNGPDVFRFHASWKGMLNDMLGSLPPAIMSADEYKSVFYPIYYQQLSDEAGNIKGVPLMYDSLALIYNNKVFVENGYEVPKTWNDFKALAMKMTKKDDNGYINFAGAAMGLTSNVDFAMDIVGILAAQSEINLYNPDSVKLAEVLTYYTDYYANEQQRVWDKSFDNSTYSFARGQVGMILAPSWLIHDILIINPNMSVGVANIPQLNIENPVEWSTHWVEGVNSQSPRAVAAWKLLEYLSSEPVLERLNVEQEAIRDFGEIYPRRSMADMLAHNHYVQPYLINAARAVSYPMNEKTFDGTINDANRAALEKAVDKILTDDGVQRLDKITEDLIGTWINNYQTYGYLKKTR